MTTKIIVNAPALMKLLEGNPGVEIELAKNAADQVATQLKKRVIGDQSKLVDQLIAEINGRLNYKYHLPNNVLKVIQEATEDHIRKLNEKFSETKAQEVFDAALERYVKKLDGRLDGIITTAVEKKVAAVFQTAARMR